jgi:hypothetical protein
LQFFCGIVVSGAFAITGGLLKLIFGQIDKLNKRVDAVSSALDDKIQQRHSENLASFDAIRNILDADRKQAYEFRIQLADRLAGLATSADISAQVNRVLIAMQQPRSSGQHLWAADPAAHVPDSAD